MLIRRIRLQNVLSFGPDGQELDLRPLNVLIGPNGSGKSNLLEAIALLQAAPRELVTPILEGGGSADWLWRGEPAASSGAIEVVLVGSDHRQPLHYRLAFAAPGQQFRLIDERLESDPGDPESQGAVYVDSDGVEATVTRCDRGAKETLDAVRVGPMNSQQSILTHLRDPEIYPQITYVASEMARISLFREWSFGRQSPARMPQKPDLPNDFLAEDTRNLGLVLNRLMRDYEARRQIVTALRGLYEGVVDFHVNIEFGTVQVFLQEGKMTIPATRLSDGTLRYLSLLTILCHPNPPPLVCLEEPELGLHPDILPGLAELLLDASERCQLIITTHSDVLVDALTDVPETVVVCEKKEGQTTMKRLEKEALAEWLERYQLGQLWASGSIGGNRW